jgi:hypothetical protein
VIRSPTVVPAKIGNALADLSVGSRVLKTNVIGVGRAIKAFLPILAKGGTVVNIGSLRIPG